MKNIPKTALLMLLLTSAGLSFAASYPSQIPATGEISTTAGSGSGVAWPNPRFVLGRGATANCITDKLTGLMWVKDLKTVLIKGGANGSSTNWQNGIDSVKQANSNQGYCGYKDWRLPNLTELRSLVNYGQSNSAEWLNSLGGFANVQPGYYFSSTIVAFYNVNFPAIVDFYHGDLYTDGRTNLGYVWPVRRAQ
jgi:hypothetical protein